MTTIKFDRVRRTGYKTVKCSGCGKKLQRQKTVERTINPFNKNTDGSIKTRGEIQRDNDNELEEWKKQDEYCKDCEES